MTLTTVAMSHSGRMLFTGTNAGTLRAMKFPLTQPGEWNEYQGHASAITKVNVPFNLWQAERHFCHLRFTGAATMLSFGHSMFTILDSIGSAVGKRPIGHAIATS